MAEAILGRVDRWPARVYVERLERAARQIEAGSTDLALFDDAAVACDRLGDDAGAIEWMKRKRALLDGRDASDEDVNEHEYRYFANLGTFHAHRWLRNGASAESVDDLRTGLELITKAIEINPEAHFGREDVQLALMEVLAYNVDHPDDQEWRDHVAFWPVSSRDRPTGEPRMVTTLTDRELVLDEVIEGLVGLIALGAAWESVDVHAALHDALTYRSDYSVAFLCNLRIRELLADGQPSRLVPPTLLDRFRGTDEELALRPWQTEAIRAYFSESRAIVDQRIADREALVLARLDAGRHPDDESPEIFWAGFVEPPLPTMPRITGETSTEAVLRYLLYGAIMIVVLLSFMAVKRQIARRRRVVPA